MKNVYWIAAAASVILVWITYRYYVASSPNFSVIPATWNPGGGVNPGMVNSKILTASNP